MRRVHVRKRAVGGSLLAVLLLALLPGTAATQTAARSSGRAALSTPELIERALARREISRFRADLFLAYAFVDPTRVPLRLRSAAAWDGTLPLLHLRDRIEAMERGPQRSRLRDLLEGSAAATNCSGIAPANTRTTDHFLIHHELPLGAGLDIDDYVTSLETAWTTEVTTFGWAAPPLHPDAGGKYHVVIADLADGLYGFVTTSGTYAGTSGDNPNTSWTEPDAVTTCAALASDYSGFPSDPQDALDSTTAHELNHSIQFGYGTLSGAGAPDDSFVEGGATWMEDEVFDTADDNHSYLWPDFDRSMGEYGASPYPYWITFRGITERYGTGVAGGGEQVMQDFWKNVSKGSHRGLAAMNDALSSRGTTLADAFHAYAIAVKFSEPCGGSYVLPYCFEEGADYVTAAGIPPVDAHGGTIASVGGTFNGNVADNHALNWVALPTGDTPYAVTLDNTSSGGQLRSTIACDTGTQIRRIEMPQVVGAGGSASVPTFDPTGCSSVVAVVTNRSQSSDDPASSTLRSYSLRTEVAPTDTSPPSAPGLEGLHPFDLQNPIPLFWSSSSDPESGVDSYVVQRRTSPAMNAFGPWRNLATSTTSSATASARPGYTYCFRVAAVNGAGLQSDWSEERCTASPLDDRALDASPGWAQETGGLHYRNTITTTARRGATLEREVSAKQLALVATRCPGCGTVKVLFQGALVKKVALDSASMERKQIVPLPAFGSRRTGLVKIKVVTRRKPVLIDGLGSSAL